MPTPTPAPGEVRIRIAVSGINPGDAKKRRDEYGYGMAYPRVIPHSDGAGHVDEVGDSVSTDWVGRRVWCYNAQSYRPFGTAAEYTVLPLEKVVQLPDSASLEQGACLGIPGITAHRAVHVAGPVQGKNILVQGGAGSVGLCAVQLAYRAGANVIATIRSAEDEAITRAAGAHHVLLADSDWVERIRTLAPDGIDHIIEVAFAENIAADAQILALDGSIATYSTGKTTPPIPFWPLAFQNIRLFFLGSDDFSSEVKVAAAQGVNDALAAGWAGFEIAERLPLEEIAQAHELVEHPIRRGRIVLTI
jgi:NADPH2:quinone reductase